MTILVLTRFIQLTCNQTSKCDFKSLAYSELLQESRANKIAYNRSTTNTTTSVKIVPTSKFKSTTKNFSKHASNLTTRSTSKWTFQTSSGSTRKHQPASYATSSVEPTVIYSSRHASNSSGSTRKHQPDSNETSSVEPTVLYSNSSSYKSLLAPILIVVGVALSCLIALVIVYMVLKYTPKKNHYNLRPSNKKKGQSEKPSKRTQQQATKELPVKETNVKQIPSNESMPAMAPKESNSVKTTALKEI